MAYQELNQSNDLSQEEKHDLRNILDEAAINTLEFLSITAVGGAWKNMTKGPLRLYAQYKWSGTIIKQYSDPFESIGTFFQTSLSSEGVKAAVVYVGKNAHGLDCGWLLAWSHSKSGGRKVYVECGPKRSFDKVDWVRIENELNNSRSVAHTTNSSTATSLYAALAGFNAKDLLAAAFRA